MNKNKSILLFLTLIFPVLIYLFLQGFGKNQFAIPVYYESGIDLPLSGCEAYQSDGPYQIDLEATEDLLGDEFTPSLISVYELGNRNSEQLRNNLYTFLEKYKDNENVKLISVKGAKDTVYQASSYQAWKRYNLADSNLMRFGRCILQLDLTPQMRADSGLVLVDHKRQIRGYYDPLVLKEIDRLNTELYILLSE